MLYREQTVVKINKNELIDRVQALKDQGFRIVQIGSVVWGTEFQIDYTFEKDYVLTTLRIMLPFEKPEVQSISHIYLCAFLYENELHDLFGVTVTDIAIDYKGTLYQTVVKTPWKPEVKTVSSEQ